MGNAGTLEIHPESDRRMKWRRSRVSASRDDRTVSLYRKETTMSLESSANSHPSKALAAVLFASLLAVSGLAHAGEARAPRVDPVRFPNLLRITPHRGVRGTLAPIVRIVSPLADSSVAPGEGRSGAGSPAGAGFLVNLEVVTRDATPIALREATLAPPVFGIRHVDQLNAGALNPDAPGLHVFFDCDLITPDGTVLPKFNNFAAAFNVAGSDDTPGDGITSWLGWHVLESVPDDVDEFTLTAAFVDEDGRIGLDRIRLRVDHSAASGQALTPAPEGLPNPTPHEGEPGAPEVVMIAPRTPTALALGAQDNTLSANNAALFFLHVSAVAEGDGQIAVSENGLRQGFTNPLPVGLILDASQLAAGGVNRNYPGLEVTFDADLVRPGGSVVPAGRNLAPAFDIAGSEIDAQGRVRVTTDWVVGGALRLAANQDSVTITAKVTDTLGRTGVARSQFRVSPAPTGQALTPEPR
jgi:hypothetical protein